MQKINLVGQKFNQLTVIAEVPNMENALDKTKRSFSAFLCRCDCGKELSVRTRTLISGTQKSCGCITREYGTKLKPGDKINRLTTISYENGHWLCVCECGKNSKVLTSNLTSGNSKSCGCLKNEIKSQELREQIGNTLRQFEPRIASARRVWKSYGYNGDENCTLTFNKFYELSQMNCSYCGIAPSNEYNCFLRKKDTSEKAKREGSFAYNGMDRIDSSLSHTDDNCISCCAICNRAKNDRTLAEFYDYINRLEIRGITDFTSIDLPDNNYIVTSMRTVYRIYKESDLSIEDFWILSQQPCFYCNAEKSNTTNYAKTDKKSSQKAIDNADFHYNGLDRINSDFPHNKDNVVPCCYYCNFAKGKLSLFEFQDWIKRIKEHTDKRMLLRNMNVKVD